MIHGSDHKISLWLVEDDSQYRQTLAFVFDRTSDLHCDRVFYAYEEVEDLLGGDEACAKPDVVLMDIGLPGKNGIEGARDLKGRWPEVPILMLTVNDSAQTIYEALRAGASGYLLKDTPIDQAIGAIREAMRGGTLMPAPVADKVLHFFADVSDPADYGLSPREYEVLRLMADGHTQKRIAAALSLSTHTVDSHRRSIYGKLHVHSNVEAVAKAYRERLV